MLCGVADRSQSIHRSINSSSYRCTVDRRLRFIAFRRTRLSSSCWIHRRRPLFSGCKVESWHHGMSVPQLIQLPPQHCGPSRHNPSHFLHARNSNPLFHALLRTGLTGRVLTWHRVFAVLFMYVYTGYQMLNNIFNCGNPKQRTSLPGKFVFKIKFFCVHLQTL